MKGVDLSNYALEDLLSFDDIFLDYFNNFLKNCAFPQVVQYNRYLGLFEEIDSTPNSIIQTDRLPKHVSLANLTGSGENSGSSLADLNQLNVQQNNDLNLTEQNKVFDWVRHERLPLFFRTDSFRDFKLCKLLTRSLDEQDGSNSANSSQLIGGYSRQSPPISASLSTDDQDNSSEDVLFPSTSNINLNESIRIGTNINNANTNIDDDSATDYIDMPFLEKFNKMLFQRPGSRALSVPSYFPFATMNQYVSSNLFTSKMTINQSTENSNENSLTAKKRVNTSKTNRTSIATECKQTLKRHENLPDLSKPFENSTNDSIALKKILQKSTSKNSEKTNKTIGFSDQVRKENDDPETYQQESKILPDDEDVEVQEVDEYDEDEYENEEDDDNDDDTMSQSTNDSQIIKTTSQLTSKKDYKEMLKIADNLSFIDNLTDEYIDNSKVHASINQYKTKFLGSLKGMNEFKEFLKNTSGYKLMKFWLDCEFYRDSMQDYDQIENMATRNRLFRDITEKHVFSFAKKVHEKITESYLSNASLTHTLFDRIQYDVLRRLRAYWVPRFILHKLKKNGKDLGTYPLPPITPEYSRESTYITAPSTSKSINLPNKNSSVSQINLTDDIKTTLYAKVKRALLADKDAGGPFLRYISTNNPESLPLILFWYDVCDFNEIDSIGYDKNSKLQHAWAIYNSYLSSTARFNIGLPNTVAEEARRLLQIQTSNSVGASTNSFDTNIFQPIMEQIIPFLQDSWIKFIKEDVVKYTNARLTALNPKQNEEEDTNFNFFLENIPEPDVIVDDTSVYVKRTWLQQFLAKKTSQNNTDRSTGKRQLTEKEKAERALRLKRMEMERKKALKAAIKRRKEEKSALNRNRHEEYPINKKKLTKTVTPSTLFSSKLTDGKDDSKSTKKRGTFQTDRSLFFDKMIHSNKSMLKLFRKNFVDNGQRDMLNKLAAYIDAKSYLDMGDNNKRNAAGTHILKSYLEKNSKKSIMPLSDKLNQRLHNDMQSDPRDARPRTPFISFLSRDLRAQLEEQYQRFCEMQAIEHGLGTGEQFALLTQTELLVLMGDAYNDRDFDFDEEKGDGKLLPTKEDRTELLKTLYEWSIGNLADIFYGFFSHLSEHGRKDGFPFLDKDLMFAIDSIRLKEINGDEVIKQKAQVMIDVYLDSQLAPVTQIDVNHDMHQKLLKSAIKISQGSYSTHDISIFDEARAQLFKELLPYWAGFKFLLKNLNEIPLTKQEKQLRERLEEFLHMKTPSPNHFKLPSISPRPTLSPIGSHPNHGNKLSHFMNTQPQQHLNIVFSLATGIKYKDADKSGMFDSSSLETKKNSISTKAGVHVK